ncbi:cob(I)yrinic acid a,c-diamide adenosyltransferase [Clostridium sardiniense]|uniref:Corrinoid adenosyltransferase n=1 Tax=Clostridium sardiniense TaxID=29369 RepID=A0ABS7KZD1_CLOSR|nr:cob(I)yrinic acid a,c-diamide adenosyltransferase [Clostridium sardiniense]MBY0756173.1 cob(I)yrinic acid a,c-diamide adenosyltransferase [Clostridium sardiniense]MDQ0458884.1 ATP:cob(I)alamin adenosyltransferase [Clostridium sardiniense]
MYKIYTKTGDKGTTALLGGSRVDKDSLRVEAYGTIDEVISLLGLAYAKSNSNELKEEINAIQKKLFTLGGELASDSKGLGYLKELVNEDDIKNLESLTDKYMEITGPIREFVIPGKNEASSVLHVARTVVRRAERRIATLAREEEIREEVRIYVNRLSDTLFAMARFEEEK